MEDNLVVGVVVLADISSVIGGRSVLLLSEIGASLTNQGFWLVAKSVLMDVVGL